jgi:serine/threonine protein kinase
MSSEAVQQLLERGQRTGLFSAATAQDLIAQLTADRALTADEAAAHMIEKKVLTPYQAEQLLAGRTDECVVAGRYRILEKLGEGGMGAVYKAHDTQLDRDVAVKVLPAKRLSDADAIARFQREARALAKVSHPNIIQAYDNGEDKGRHFLVMEYVEGVNLSAILRERGAIPPTLAADMIYQVALGLQHAHEKGLVHRDLKPSNLLLSRPQMLAGRPPPAVKDQETLSLERTWSYVAPAAFAKGIVKILDLGLARFLQDQLGDSPLTKEGIGVGTPDYMAPEQFRDALHADARTDIYGLGCTLYQLISGTVPFPGSSFSEKADAHAKKEPIPLEERCPEVPTGLAFVVSKMMAKHPADRFQTAREVAEALAPYIAGASHSAILLRQTMRFHAGQLTLRAPSRRKRLLAWAGAALATACFLGLLILTCKDIFLAGFPLSQDDRQAQSRGPGTQASAPSTPEVVTIDNGLTVAKDGTGQFRTIGAALDKIKPGQTIRVLDDATYAEALTIDDPEKHHGIVLETGKRATLELASTARRVVLIQNVGTIKLRGFRFHAQGVQEFTGQAFVEVMGRCPGVVLANLDCRSAGQMNGIRLQDLRIRATEAPVAIMTCTLNVARLGIDVSGTTNNPSHGLLIRENRIYGAAMGLRLTGHIARAQIVANLIWDCGMAGLQLQDMAPDADVLLANNTSFKSGASFRLWLNPPFATAPLSKQIALQNNLFFGGVDGDMVFALGKGAAAAGPGDGQLLLRNWTFDHNWRDLQGSEEQAIVPIAPADKRIDEEVAALSRDPNHPDFLRPTPASSLATGGAGGDLPAYVGAVPPEGAPWDWDKTWKARATTAAEPRNGV